MRAISWQLGGDKDAQRPEPIPRPGEHTARTEGQPRRVETDANVIAGFFGGARRRKGA